MPSPVGHVVVRSGSRRALRTPATRHVVAWLDAEHEQVEDPRPRGGRDPGHRQLATDPDRLAPAARVHDVRRHPSPDQAPEAGHAAARPRPSIGRTPRLRGSATGSPARRASHVCDRSTRMPTELVVARSRRRSALGAGQSGPPSRWRTSSCSNQGCTSGRCSAVERLESRASSWAGRAGRSRRGWSRSPSGSRRGRRSSRCSRPSRGAAPSLGLGADRRREREDLVDLGLGGARCAPA